MKFNKDQIPQFKVGDRVTYKAPPYKYGGDSHKGFRGKVLDISGWDSDVNCAVIEVSVPGGGDYVMLESEFEEYTKAQDYEIC